MLVTYPLRLELDQSQSLPPIPVVQEDSGSRALALALYAGGESWPIPEGVTPVVRYRKPDGTGGSYDTLPDGSVACTISGNVITCTLAPQVCTVQGPVQLAVSLLLGESILSTFHVDLLVRGLPSAGAESEDYRYVTAFLPQPDQAQAGQVLMVREVSQSGRVLTLEAVNAKSVGIGTDGGYYEPYVRQVNDTVVSLEFTGSTQTMQPNILGFILHLPVGPAGATPVKGTDYFTDEDKAELVQAVMEALPEAEEVSV